MQTFIVCLLASYLAFVRSSETYSVGSRSQKYPFGESFEAPEYEIVVARYRENQTTLAWLAEVPTFYQITIIDKVSLSSSGKVHSDIEAKQLEPAVHPFLQQNHCHADACNGTT